MSDPVRDAVVPSRWDTLDNARAYDRFATRYGYYRSAAEAAARLSGLKAGQTAVDLGCGTGISTRALLARLGPDARVWGLDPAPSMLDVARRKDWPDGVRFAVGDDTDLGALVGPGGTDLVLCASTLWLAADVAGLLARVRSALAPSGAFVATLPAELLGDADHLVAPDAVAFWQEVVAVREALAIPPPEAPTAPVWTLTEPGLRDLLRAQGFGACRVHRISYRMTHQEWLGHLSIPAVIGDLLPRADDAARREFVRLMAGRIDPERRSERRWSIVLARA